MPKQQVSDREFAAAGKRFPLNPPATKEAYFYRRMFEQYFPGEACAETVPGGKSIACSSPAAIAWDASLRQRGRSVRARGGRRARAGAGLTGLLSCERFESGGASGVARTPGWQNT